jgi:hypothetical protein
VTAVGWAVVGPGGAVDAATFWETQAHAWCLAVARLYVRPESGELAAGFRLARVRIEVIEEGDAARGENDGR